MIREVESWTYDLSSPVLHNLGLVTAVKQYIEEEFQRTHGIICELKSNKDIGILNDDIKALLFSAIKELLTNVVKHANAHKIKVSIQRNHKQINAIVQDDGIGFKETGSLEFFEMEGFGLFGVREQLAHFGGHITIRSEGGCGTTVIVAVPSITELP